MRLAEPMAQRAPDAGPPHRTAYVVDDDAGDRLALESLLAPKGIEVRCFECAEHFLEALDALSPALVFLDARMPGLGGLDVIELMRGRGLRWPIIMVSGQADIPLAVRSLHIGATDFIEKPCREADLDNALRRASRVSEAGVPSLRKQEIIEKVTPRELQILELLVNGQANKSIAFTLGISEKTVEVHRAKLMRRLQAKSFADLIRCAVEAGIGR